MNKEKLEMLLDENDELVDSFDYNLRNNVPNFPLKPLIIAQWDIIYEALRHDE